MATLAALLSEIDIRITDNNANEIDGPVLNALLKLLTNNTYPQPQAPTTSFPGWSNTVNYTTGNTIFENDLIYKAADDSGPDTSAGPVEPGTNTDYWVVVDPSTLSHDQNTDVGLGRHIGLIDGGGTFLLENSASRNFFVLDPGAGSGQIAFSLDSNKYNYTFITYIPSTASGFTALFESDVNQQTTANGLELSPGDWAMWQGNVDGKTRLVSSNVQDAPVGDAIRQISVEFTPDIILSGTTTTDTGTPNTVSILNVADSGTTDTDSLTNTVQAWTGDQFATNELVGYLIEFDYPIAGTKEVREITQHSSGGLLTLDANPSETELNVPYRIVEAFFTANEFINDYLVLVYPSLTQYAPVPNTAHKITANTYDGDLTVTQDFAYTGAANFQVHAPQRPILGDDYIIACVNTDNMVIEVPAITTDYERQVLTIYREGTNDPDQDYVTHIFFTDPIRGSNKVDLLADGENLTVLAHNYVVPHWDEYNRNDFCLCLNVNIETADTTALTNTTDLPIVATAWDMNRPNRFEVETVSNSIVATYKSLIPRHVEIIASVSVVRTGGTPTVTITAQIDTSTGWTNLLSKAVTVSNTSPIENVTFPIGKRLNFDDKIRFVAKTSGDGYYISELSLSSSQANA